MWRLRAFEKNEDGTCCLCGSAKDLTGEHKIKASLIRKQFSNNKTLLVQGRSSERPKIAQSSKSKVFHFHKARLCKTCNSSRTQDADTAFESFVEERLQAIKNGKALWDFSVGRVIPATGANELNIFRYFSKIICCYLAEVGGPRPIALAKFGLFCYFDNRRLFVRTIESSFSIGGVQIRFGCVLRIGAKIDLQMNHSRFVSSARRATHV